MDRFNCLNLSTRVYNITIASVVEKIPTSGVPQLPADYSSISAIPEVITDSSPVVVEAHLNPPLVWHFTIHKPYCAIGAADGWVLVCVFRWRDIKMVITSLYTLP